MISLSHQPLADDQLTPIPETALIYRWVNARAARSYMRYNAMIDRTKHWLPKELTGLDKIYRKRGLSFAIEFGWWTSAELPIGFAVNPKRLENRISRIDGHEVFIFSGLRDHHRSGVPCWPAHQQDYAVKKSLESPDEAFVIGDVRDVRQVVSEIIVRDEASERMMRPWCEQNDIPMRGYPGFKLSAERA
ncbi:hypothetical protein [Sphingomonas sp. 3-13AW]|uniref:hypothetical protein n=1 Tax=Sphingomonas sp. 3-13AW TaxID=3050450 RepID=UPI003BB5E06B